MPYAFGALNDELLPQLRDLLPKWLPGGALYGHEYKTSNLGGGNGQSLSVNVLTGKWKDFADDESGGGDVVSLYAAIFGVDNGEAYRQLGGKLNGATHHTQSTIGEDRAPPAAGHKKITDDDDTISAPPQVDFQPSLFKHATHGTPSQFWVYRDLEGEPTHVVARYDHDDGKKSVLPWTYRKNRWTAKAPPAPRPLYGLEKLKTMPGKRVLICEGEKATDAAQRFFPHRPCLTWMGGTGGVKQADWTPLRGREVTLWPDADEAGWKAVAAIAGLLLGLGCQVWRVNTKGKPDGWDAADAEIAGTPVKDLLAWLKSVTTPVVEEAKKVTRVQTIAKGEVIEHDPAAGSLMALWQEYGFSLKGNGRPYATHANVMKCVAIHCEERKIDLYFDDFTLTVMMGERPYDDNANIEFTVWIQERRLIAEITPTTVMDGVRAYALQHRRNPLREWLQELHWDGENRIQRLLAAGFGTKDTEYHAEVGRCFMVGMVARVLSPGCQNDCMPVFEGEQGEGKTSALRILGGDYYAEVHESIDTKDFYLAITGKMLVEISEMDAFRRTEIQRIKGIISTKVDRYRAPYDRISADHPRAGVFAGTTNATDWNTDDSGARRFWPVNCGRIDREWIKDNRNQLFAEAVARYERGDDWWRVPEAAAKLQRDARLQFDPWSRKVLAYCEGRDWVDMEIILANVVELDMQDATKADANRVGAILRAAGWINRAMRVDGCLVRRWVKKPLPSDST